MYNNSGVEVARDGDWLIVDGAGPFEGEADACGRPTYVILVDPVIRSDTRP